MTEPRTMISLRVKTTAVKVLEELAKKEGMTRSEMIRVLLGEAVMARMNNV